MRVFQSSAEEIAFLRAENKRLSQSKAPRVKLNEIIFFEDYEYSNRLSFARLVENRGQNNMVEVIYPPGEQRLVEVSVKDSIPFSKIREYYRCSQEFHETVRKALSFHDLRVKAAQQGSVDV